MTNDIIHTRAILTDKEQKEYEESLGEHMANFKHQTNIAGEWLVGDKLIFNDKSCPVFRNVAAIRKKSRTFDLDFELNLIYAVQHFDLKIDNCSWFNISELARAAGRVI